MIPEKQFEKANKFSALHKEKHMFVLPNVWDVGSAVIFEKEGFPAVATTSAGIAYAMGRPDGQEIEFDVLWEITRNIAGRINIPLSVDFERGYAETTGEIRENALKLLEAGAVGFNLEDGLSDGTLTPLPLQLEKIRVLADLKKELGMDFVINARTCAYWLKIGDERAMFETAVERGNAFANAGADCVFVPGAIDKETVKKFVLAINAPINIILNGKFHDFNELDALGVRRLSVGSGPARYIYGKTIEMAERLAAGDTEDVLAGSFTYAKANAFFGGINEKRDGMSKSNGL